MWTRDAIRTAWQVSGKNEFADFLMVILPPSEDYTWYAVYLHVLRAMGERHGCRGILPLNSQMDALAYVLECKVNEYEPDEVRQLLNDEAIERFLSANRAGVHADMQGVCMRQGQGKKASS